MTRGESMREEIDSLASDDESPLLLSPAEPKTPVMHGPLNKMELYKHIIESAKIAQAGEVERLQNERTANQTAMDAMQDETNISNNLLSAFGGIVKQQVEAIVDNAALIDEEFKDLCVNLSVLNKSMAKSIVNPEIIRRFSEIKNRTIEVARKAVAVVVPESVEGPLVVVADESEKLLTIMNVTVQKAKGAIDELQQIQPSSQADQEIINELIASNDQLIDAVGANVQPFMDAIENNDPDLPLIIEEIAADLNTSINFSNDADDLIVQKAQQNGAVSRAVLEAADVQDERNKTLMEVVDDALELAVQVEMITQQYERGYVPKDLKVRRHMGLETLDDEFIDLDEAMMVEIEAEQQEKDYQRRSSAQFSLIYEQTKTLKDVTFAFNLLLDNSLTITEDLLGELEEAHEKSETQEEQDVIQEVIEKVDEMKKVLEKSREDVNDVVDEENFAEALAVEQGQNEVPGNNINKMKALFEKKVLMFG